MVKKIIYLWIHKIGLCKPMHGCHWKGVQTSKAFCPFLLAVYNDLDKENK